MSMNVTIRTTKIERKNLESPIIWEMHEFSHKFSVFRENASKPNVLRETGKLVLILFLE